MENLFSWISAYEAIDDAGLIVKIQAYNLKNISLIKYTEVWVYSFVHDTLTNICNSVLCI